VQKEKHTVRCAFHTSLGCWFGKLDLPPRFVCIFALAWDGQKLRCRADGAARATLIRVAFTLFKSGLFISKEKGHPCGCPFFFGGTGQI